MIISKRLENAEFIMSKDELTYSAVIEDFKNASQIHILTYNISKDQNVLLKALKDCEKDTEICIVSNIPGRWESYFGKTYADKAKRSISLYGEYFDGKEDHVWMSKEGFGDCQVGDCFSFFAEVYRYLKTSNGKMIDFGLRNPDNIKKIESYELPSDDELLMQSIDQIICETCMFRDHCYGGMCIANREWRDNMRRSMFEMAKGKKAL